MSAPQPALVGPVPDVIPVPFLLSAPGDVVVNGDWLLAGWTMVENTGGGTATIELFDGTSAGGTSLGKRTLVANESITDQLPYVHCQSGVFASITGGIVKGVLYVAKT